MKLKHLAATAACTTALLAIPAVPASAAQPQPARPGVAVDVEAGSPKEVLAYWTAERMERAAANPAPVRAVRAPQDGPDRRSSAAGTPHLTASAPAVRPTAAPAGRTTLSSTTSEASLQAAAAEDIAVAQDVPASTSIPNVVVGKLFYKAPDGQDHTCSASVIVSDTANTIWTAGHCVHLGDGSGEAGWSTDIIFVPGYKDGQEPWGVWVADRKYAPTQWIEDGDHQSADLAAVVLQPNTTYGRLQDNVGALGYQFGSVTDHQDAFTVGYPGEGYQRTDMDGEQMMYCYGNTEDAQPFWPLDDRLKMDCDMGKGASGGPMFIGALGGNPQIVGANSHYESDATTGERISDDLFSSLHDANAVAVINEVDASA
ncbi:hypothetical protein [Streptomyces sp. S.PNR 29]|uniref:trypsin-like peptidase domain-containing protein n=1 Tax=Streptomyces sp. S.PNR 29 TaxID=2973805 RepID=UPI0025B23FED|nr:hypothetical protein [Streptomyces sp. S.PNR 29]MDN0194539.1 hypothetical protein [Streptomyces sp. S.PNR 29]